MPARITPGHSDGAAVHTQNNDGGGDGINRLDWTYQDNYFGSGLPPAWDNQSSWGLMRPRLADASIKPTPADIAWTRDVFRDLLRLRGSSTLFRLRSADDIKARLRFPNTGSSQIPSVLVGQLDGQGYPGAGFRELLYFINVDIAAQTLTLPDAAGKAFVLHPVHRAAGAADPRAREATVDSASGRFTIAPRTAVVFVRE